MKSLLIGLIFSTSLSAFGNQCNGDCEPVNLTDYLKSFNCYSVFEGKSTEVARGVRNNFGDPLWIAVNYTDPSGNRKVGAFELQQAILGAQSDYQLEVEAVGPVGKLKISDQKDFASIWIDGMEQDYLKLLCEKELF